MQLLRTFLLLSATCVLGCSAKAYQEHVWRDCSPGAHPAHVKYMTGTDSDYFPGWATNKVSMTHALLDDSKIQIGGTDSAATATAVQAACNAILTDTQIGEMYMINQDKHNCKSASKNCIRMAVYEANVGTGSGIVTWASLNEPGGKHWTCTKDPWLAPNKQTCSAMKEHVWRDCTKSAHPAHVKYMTGTDSDYFPGWATNKVSMTHALLDNSKIDINGSSSKTTAAAVQAACNAILTPTQVGEIYMIGDKAKHNCKSTSGACIRMAVYEVNVGNGSGLVTWASLNEPGGKHYACTKEPALAPNKQSCSTMPTDSTMGKTTVTALYTPKPKPEASSAVAPFAAPAIAVLSALAAAIM